MTIETRQGPEPSRLSGSLAATLQAHFRIGKDSAATPHPISDRHGEEGGCPPDTRTAPKTAGAVASRQTGRESGAGGGSRTPDRLITNQLKIG